MKNMMIVAAIAACVVGCKSITFEKIERTPVVNGTNVVSWTEKIVRGSYWKYGLQDSLEGLEIDASAAGAKVKIDKSSNDVSEKHEKIIDSTGSAVGSAVGAAAAAAATL